MTAEEAYRLAREEIITEFHNAKEWKRSDTHPFLNTFADGVEEGLSKALLIMNKHRTETKNEDN